MKASLKQEQVFTLTVGDLAFPGMRVVSRWNGLMELANEKQEKLIMTDPEAGRTEFNRIFDKVWGSPGPCTNDVIVLMGSPRLLALIEDQKRGTA